MDITLKTGRKFYQTDPILAAILIELGLAEKIEKPPAPSPWPPAGYAVATMFRGNPLPRPHVVRQDGFGGTCLYDAPPADCPEGVAQQWRALTSRQLAQDEANAAQKSGGVWKR